MGERANFLKASTISPFNKISIFAKLDTLSPSNEYGYIECEGLNFVKVTIQNTYTSLEIGNEAYENSTRYKIGTTHYFLVEPILWRVLTTNAFTGEIFCISNNIVDAQIYVSETNTRLIDDRIIYPSNYEHSDIRKWCNNVFYNQAFSDAEKELVVYKTINNQYPINLSVDVYDRDTEDYVYIPSLPQAHIRPNPYRRHQQPSYKHIKKRKQVFFSCY